MGYLSFLIVTYLRQVVETFVHITNIYEKIFNKLYYNFLVVLKFLKLGNSIIIFFIFQLFFLIFGKLISKETKLDIVLTLAIEK